MYVSYSASSGSERYARVTLNDGSRVCLWDYHRDWNKGFTVQIALDRAKIPVADVRYIDFYLHVNNPDRVWDRYTRYYPDGRIESIGSSEWAESGIEVEVENEVVHWLRAYGK